MKGELELTLKSNNTNSNTFEYLYDLCPILMSNVWYIPSLMSKNRMLLSNLSLFELDSLAALSRNDLSVIIFFWTFQDTLIFRFAMRYDTASATYTLQLKDVQRSDEGRYECQIIVALNNKVTQSLFLRVLEPPIINDNSTRRWAMIQIWSTIRLKRAHLNSIEFVELKSAKYRKVQKYQSYSLD